MVLLLTAACVPMAVDEAGARTAATAFVGRQAALGTTIEDIEVTAVRQETRGPIPGLTGSTARRPGPQIPVSRLVRRHGRCRCGVLGHVPRHLDAA